ncbi:hypothetical protein FSPOR_1884 [Fusarium sporotrichioides]|uniref:DUF2306 domain-containing protein n=1 Tax=Fusarium sporotrichioides TaxID=5514 RepID=A0A395SQ15_FUSSP|nr:hypothetical protein FSPOR_1884 [Fusarium sporotrichioides]
MSLKRRLGFSSTRSFILTSIFTGFLFLFSTLQLPYIDIDRVFCAEDPWAVPGECYLFKRPGLMRNSLVVHLATFLPAGALVCFQFIPALQRPKYAKFHRVNGYLVLGLSAIGTVTALIISEEAMGGPIMNRIGTSVLATAIGIALLKAMIAIKRGKVQEHRAWMLRGWFYATSIITMRIILISLAHIIGTPSRAMTLSLAAALRIGYSIGGWAAFAIHSVSIEIYIRRTSPQYKSKAL